MKLRRLAVLLLSILTVFTLFACKQPEEEKPEPPKPAAERATVITLDDALRGDWAERYGANGYVMVNGDWSGSGEVPANALIAKAPTGIEYSIDGVTQTRVKAVESDGNNAENWMLNNGQRVLDSRFYTAEDGYFDLYLDAVDDKTHTVALYLYSTEINALNVEIYDDVTAAQPKLLDEISVDYIRFGRYVVIEFNRKCVVSIGRVNASDASGYRLSGIFFDGKEGASASTLVSKQTDSTTKGEWYKKYGREGWWIPLDSYDNVVDHQNAFLAPGGIALSNFPSSLNSYALNGHSTLGVNGTEGSDDGSVPDPDGVSNNGEGYMLMLPESDSFESNSYIMSFVVVYGGSIRVTIDLQFHDDQEHTVAFYFADNEMSVSSRGDRSIDVYDNTMQRLSAETVTVTDAQLKQGYYAVFKVKGPVRFYFSGSGDIVFNAMFLGDAYRA